MPRRSLSPDIEREPVQPDPMLDEGRAGPVGITAAVLATALIVVIVLYGLLQPPRHETVAASPPDTTFETTGNTGPGTTGQGSTNSSRPQPSEQDLLEQTTRP